MISNLCHTESPFPFAGRSGRRQPVFPTALIKVMFCTDSITRSLRIPEAEAEQRLRQELAVALYAQGLLSFGKASELAGEDRFRFASILTQRGIARHYGHEELTEDLKYASGE